jgi:hypothetical protein
MGGAVRRGHFPDRARIASAGRHGDGGDDGHVSGHCWRVVLDGSRQPHLSGKCTIGAPVRPRLRHANIGVHRRACDYRLGRAIPSKLSSSDDEYPYCVRSCLCCLHTRHRDALCFIPCGERGQFRGRCNILRKNDRTYSEARSYVVHGVFFCF